MQHYRFIIPKFSSLTRVSSYMHCSNTKPWCMFVRHHYYSVYRYIHCVRLIANGKIIPVHYILVWSLCVNTICQESFSSHGHYPNIQSCPLYMGHYYCIMACWNSMKTGAIHCSTTPMIYIYGFFMTTKANLLYMYAIFKEIILWSFVLKIVDKQTNYALHW